MDKSQDLRHRFEKLLGAPVPDAQYEIICNEVLGSDYDVELRSDRERRRDAEDLARVFKPIQSAFGNSDRAHAVVRLDPPEWWASESELVLEALRDEQEEALSLFGLKGPIAIGDLGEFIQEQTALERVEGDPASLPYPVPSRNNAGVLYAAEQRIFRGVSEAEVVARGGVPVRFGPDVRDVTDAMRRHDQALDWAQPRTQRLWRLLEQANRIHSRAGFGVDQAVGFLLSDLRSVRPWVNIRGGYSFAPGVPNRWFFKIDVGTPEISPEVLAGAYGRFLDDNGLRQPPRRTGRDSRSVLYAWVSEIKKREPGISFRTLHDRWSRDLAAGLLPAGAVGYTYESMRSAYYQKQRDLRGKAGEEGGS